MENSQELLIERLNARAHDPERATDERPEVRDDQCKPVVYVAAPPATPEQVESAERRLDFPLPPLLRQIYLEVGNGGFGPGYGLLGLPTSASDADKSVVGRYAALRKIKTPPRWPAGLIPACEWGCGIASFLDCSRPEVMVIRFDPNMAKADVAARVPAHMRFDQADRVADACWVEAASFGEWLEAWADGKRLFYLGYGGAGEDADEDDIDEEGGEEEE